MPIRPAAVLTAALLLSSGCASHHDQATTATSDDTATRTIDIEMQDNRFVPATIDVEAGETVTLRFTNRGTVDHEAVIGDADLQEMHATVMAADPDAAHDSGHDHLPTATVAPGEVGELTTTFDAAGTTLIGCHEPGHYEAGMTATVTIS